MPGDATRSGTVSPRGRLLDPTRFYQTFGVGQGSLAGVEARAALDDFRVDFRK